MTFKKNNFWIWGLHSVLEALKHAPETISEIHFQRREVSDRVFEKLSELSNDHAIRLTETPTMPTALSENRHQGVAASLRYFNYRNESDLRQELASISGFSQWALLDGIEDPRNFGAILRSAAAFGLKGVIVGEKFQAPVTGVVAQASAGTCFQLPIYQVPTTLKVPDLFPTDSSRIIGLDGRGEDLRSLLSKSENLDRALIWVVGAEGKGIHGRLKEKLKSFARIEISESVESLNASVAASLVFFAATEAQKLLR